MRRMKFVYERERERKKIYYTDAQMATEISMQLQMSLLLKQPLRQLKIY